MAEPRELTCGMSAGPSTAPRTGWRTQWPTRGGLFCRRRPPRRRRHHRNGIALSCRIDASVQAEQRRRNQRSDRRITAPFGKVSQRSDSFGGGPHGESLNRGHSDLLIRVIQRTSRDLEPGIGTGHGKAPNGLATNRDVTVQTGVYQEVVTLRWRQQGSQSYRQKSYIRVRTLQQRPQTCR